MNEIIKKKKTVINTTLWLVALAWKKFKYRWRWV